MKALLSFRYFNTEKYINAMGKLTYIIIGFRYYSQHNFSEFLYYSVLWGQFFPNLWVFVQAFLPSAFNGIRLLMSHRWSGVVTALMQCHSHKCLWKHVFWRLPSRKLRLHMYRLEKPSTLNWLWIVIGFHQGFQKIIMMAIGLATTKQVLSSLRRKIRLWKQMGHSRLLLLSFMSIIW